VLVQIQEITDQAMNGEIPLEAMFTKKMSIISPSKQDITYAVAMCKERFTPGALETIKALREHNIEVFIISSGFHDVIDPVANILGIDSDHVIANNLLFQTDGTYAGIDPTSRLTTSDGKPKTIVDYITNTDTTVIVGDGMTDAACAPVVTQFIGFGGAARRSNVEKVSDIYITEKNLAAILPHILHE
jgi:phosphoserine phosphatase